MLQCLYDGLRLCASSVLHFFSLILQLRRLEQAKSFLLLIILIFSFANEAQAFSPSTECTPNVRSISVASGGTIDWTTSSQLDLSI